MNILEFASALFGSSPEHYHDVVIETKDGGQITIDDVVKYRNDILIQGEVWSDAHVIDLNSEIDNLKSTVSSMDNKIEDLRDEVSRLTDEIAELRNMLNDRDD